MASEKKKRVTSADTQPAPAAPPVNQAARYRKLTWMIGIALFALLYWVRLDRTVGMFMDDAWYALLGKALASGHGYTLINSPTPGILPLYPPVYPALLALVFKLAPAFPENVWLLKCVSILAMAGAGWLTYVYFTRCREWNATTALLVAAITAFSPGLVFMATASLMSECVFTALLLLALVAVERCAQRGTILWAALAGLACSLAFLTRSMAIGLIIAAILYFLYQRRWRELVTFAAVVVLLLGSWTLFTRARKPTPAQRAEVNNYIVRPYNEQFWDRLAGYESQGSITLSELPARLTSNLGSVFSSDAGGILLPSFFPSLNQGLAERGNTMQLLLSLLVCGFVIAGYVTACRERVTVAELAFPLSLAIVIAWPFPPYRFLLPFLPLIAGYFLTGTRLLWRAHQKLNADNSTNFSQAGFSWMPLNVVAGLLLLVALIGHANYLGRQYADFATERPRMMRIFDEQEKVLRWAASNLPKNEAIVTTNPALAHLYTGNATTTFDNPTAHWELWNQLGIRHLVQLSPTRLPEPNGPEKAYRITYRAGGELNLRVVDLGAPNARPKWGEAAGSNTINLNN